MVKLLLQIRDPVAVHSGIAEIVVFAVVSGGKRILRIPAPFRRALAHQGQHKACRILRPFEHRAAADLHQRK